MKRILCIVLALVICLSNEVTAFASELPKKLPSGIAFDELEATVDSYVTEHQETTAAVSVAAFTSEEIILEKAYGFMDIENQVKNDMNAVFEWGSCTKLLTWASVMQLAERGLVDLNADIRSYLPEGFFKKLNYDTPITLLNLMNHNAGWQEMVTDLFLENKKDIRSLGDALRYTEPEQVNRPSTVVAYSNWGSALAGYIVECVSGKPFSVYVKENIFDPLEMKHTALSSDLSDNPWVYEKRSTEKCYTNDNQSLGTCIYYISLYPAGMATGTLNDFVKFAQAFLPKEGEPSQLFENSSTLDEMLSTSLTYGDQITPRNCHGLWTDQLGVPVLWHNGGTIGSSSWFAFDPASGVGMIVLTNQSDEFIYNCGLLPIVFGKYEKLDAGTDSAISEDISGVYVDSRSCFKGYAKLYSLFTIMPLISSGKDSYSVSGSEITVSGLGNHSYLMDMGGIKQFLIYADSDNEGNSMLENAASDYLEVKGYELLAKYALLLLFSLAVIYFLIAIIIKLIRVLLHKKPSPFPVFRWLVPIASITSFALFLSIAYKLMSSNSVLYQSIEWRLILCAILAFMPILYTIVLIVQWKRYPLSRKEKVMLILDAIMGLLVSINVYYWEL